MQNKNIKKHLLLIIIGIVCGFTFLLSQIVSGIIKIANGLI